MGDESGRRRKTSKQLGLRRRFGETSSKGITERAFQTRKRWGELSELAFVYKAASVGFGVAKPYGDSERYDFILDSGERLWRVQVKSAYRGSEEGGYSFHAHGNAHDEVYSAEEIDVLVAYVVPEDAWYVVPVEVFQTIKSMKLFPASRRRRSRFEKYREAWGWMKPGRVGRKKR
jgi:hypothetical protein